MECHDARMLLNFAYRGCEELDATEGDALQQHLAQCPECAALVQADRQLDETIGQAMRAIAVPADLKQKVLTRLAVERPRLPWKRLSYAAAAAVLLTITGGLGWYYYLLPEITVAYLQEYASRAKGWNEDQVEQYFDDHGMPVRAPRMFDYSYLRHVDIVELKGRRVAKLSFTRIENERIASADVLILSPRQFRMNDLPEMDAPHFTSIRIRHNDDFTYVMLYDGNLGDLMRSQF